MSRRPTARIVSFVLLLIALQYSICAQCVPKQGTRKSETFSSVTDVKTPPSVVHSDAMQAGFELVLDESSNIVFAKLRQFRGDASPFETQLQGSIEEESGKCSIHLSGRNGREEVKIDGVIGVANLNARIVTRQKGVVESLTVSLRRKAPERIPAEG